MPIVTSPASSVAGRSAAIRPSTWIVSPIRTGRRKTTSRIRRSAITRSGSNGTRPTANETTSMPCAMRWPNALLRGPLGVGVLRVPVAGERGEGDDVGLGDGARRGC